MKAHKGWIALDIDGTITDQAHHIPDQVVHYLGTLASDGWQLLFITGRTLSFGLSALSVFEIPYLLAVQNGADLLSMPERSLVRRSYLPPSIVERLNTVYLTQEEDFVIYAGYEKGDFCYYRPARFSPRIMAFLEKVKTLSPEPWQPLKEFTFSKTESFPLIKCMGSQAAMEKVHEILHPDPHIAISMIKDPHFPGVYLNLITAPRATKGHILEDAQKVLNKKGLVIAAGDDFNDVTMLKVANVPIAMGTAPKEVLAYGKIIAKPASELGIIDALHRATTRRL